MENQKTNRLGKASTIGVGLALIAGVATASADTAPHAEPDQTAENNSTADYKDSAAHDYAEALIAQKAESTVEDNEDITPEPSFEEESNDTPREPLPVVEEVQEKELPERQEAPVEVVEKKEAPVVEETPEEEPELEVEETETQEESNEQVDNERSVSVVEQEPEYNSTITVVTTDDEKTVDVTDDSKTLEEILDENVDNEPSTYRDESNKVLDKETLGNALENESSITVYPTQRDVSTEEVSIPFQTEEKETDELYEGETEVEQEGVEGTGVKVTERVTNAHEENSQQNLKIVDAPQKEIILVGTKPEPEPEPEPVVEEEPEVVEEPETSTEESTTAAPAQSSSTPPAPAPGRNQGSTVGTGESINDTSQTNNAVVDLALKQAGKPYVWGGTSTSGFDCSGLVYWANAQNGKSVPRTASAQGAASKNVSWDNIQVGDIVYTNTHIGIYAGNDRVVHAANPSRGVVIDSASSFQQRGFKVGRL